MSENMDGWMKALIHSSIHLQVWTLIMVSMLKPGNFLQKDSPIYFSMKGRRTFILLLTLCIHIISEQCCTVNLLLDYNCFVKILLARKDLTAHSDIICTNGRSNIQLHGISSMRWRIIQVKHLIISGAAGSSTNGK